MLLRSTCKEVLFSMNHKCNCGCLQSFVPVDSNWDFNMDRDDGGQRSNCNQQSTVRQGECCEYQSRNRNTACGCEEKSACECQNRNRSTTCGCENQARRTLPAMVKINMQELGEAYQPACALKAGTLFPELHKPMRGYCPSGEGCGDDCQAVAFMLWELRLYLNTHPHDQEAIALFRRLCSEACQPNYASAFLTDEGCADWSWAKNPWPWEYSANGCNCKKEGHGHVCV